MRKVSLNCGGNAVVIIKFGFEYIILFMASIRIGIWHRKSESQCNREIGGRKRLGEGKMRFISSVFRMPSIQHNRIEQIVSFAEKVNLLYKLFSIKYLRATFAYFIVQFKICLGGNTLMDF